NNDSNNHGVKLQDTTESNNNYWATFHSSESSSANKPKLTITYTDGSRSYSLQMKSFVDQGYRQRFSDAISKVQGHHAVVKNILNQLFNINVTYTVSAYTSSADDCKNQTYGIVTSSNLTGTCGHSSEHLTTSALRTELVADQGAGTATISKYLWTGHILPGNPRSVSYRDYHTVVLTPYAVVYNNTYGNQSDAKVQQESRYSLLHETSHQLGTHDHYCYGAPPNSDCNNPYCYECKGMALPTCIMSDRCNIETTGINSLYCTVCKNNINSHLNNHH
ncbi:MAG: hypothetical protein MJ075_00900, partial [Oscillospiraceae bacterium]|nr:hypothetical protein [Oscillospiraceae bacterium]